MQTLFSTPQRIKVIDYALNHPNDELKVRQASKELKLSPYMILGIPHLKKMVKT